MSTSRNTWTEHTNTLFFQVGVEATGPAILRFCTCFCPQAGRVPSCRPTKAELTAAIHLWMSTRRVADALLQGRAA
jgi:hypothetical protein